MNGERDFDDYVKNGLDGYSTVVSPHIWENIVAERRKKKPVGFWVNFLNVKNALLLVGSIATISSAVWMLNHSKDTKTSQQLVNTAISSKQNNSLNPQTDKQHNIITADLLKEDQKDLLGKEKNNLPKEIAQTKLELNKNELHSKQLFRIPSVSTKNIVIDESGMVTEKNNANPDNEFTVNRILTEPPLIASSIKSITITQNRNYPNVTIPGCPTVEEAAAGNKKYVEVYLGPDFTLRNFKDTIAQSVYLQRRKASTEVSSAYSAGIRYTKVFNNGVSVKAGLNYSQINEKFSFIQNNLVQVTYIIDPNTGDTTGSYTVTGTRKKTTYNKYRTLDVPLLIGYEIGNGRLHVNISAGAMVNLYSWQRGEVLDTNYLPVSITTGKSVSSPYQFKTNVGVGLTGGVGIYYKLTDILHVLAEPYFRYNLKPMSKETLTLQQKYNTMGIRLGVRLDLK